jgi:hypothetical protein
MRKEFSLSCWIRNEGRPLELGIQVLGSNHLKRLWSKAMVVSVEEQGTSKRCQVRIGEANVSEPLMKCRDVLNDIKTRSFSFFWDQSVGNLVTVTDGVRHLDGANPIQVLIRNVGSSTLMQRETYKW